MTLLIFAGSEARPRFVIPLDPPADHRTGNVWHVFVHDPPADLRYSWRVVDGSGRAWPELLDPYAPGVEGRAEFGRRTPGELPRRGCLLDEDFDWGDDRHPRTPWARTIIYELQVRTFTRHASSGVASPGTFDGLRQKIPYLVELGVTAVELLPVADFEEDESGRIDPVTGERLLNVWGYHPLSFMAPKVALAAGDSAPAAANEFKGLVRALHSAGIEVILDVVYNHTGEAEPGRPTVSWRGLAESTYYILDGEPRPYLDFTGCGNTVNANHPVTADLIIAAMRHWVTEYRVDGFRLDLASALARGEEGSVLDAPPLLARIAADPVLAGAKLIAEPWDATGFHQLGSFPGKGRFAQWNDRFRDDVRRFVRGDEGQVGGLVARLLGSRDVFHQAGAAPWQSINYVTAHDGFTLRDLVSYSHKHNMRNGEQGRDGTDENHSDNCGEEGDSTDPVVLALRARRQRNILALLLLANGTPMLLAGDELGQTQRGNNNAYCQDNDIAWIHWDGLARDAELHGFVRRMIALRQRLARLRCERFGDESGPAVRWHGVTLDAPDWAYHSHSLSMEVDAGDERALIVVNGFVDALEFECPPPAGDGWRRVLDTAASAPEAVAMPEARSAEALRTVEVAPRSVLVLWSGLVAA